MATNSPTALLTQPWLHQADAITFAADKPGTLLAMEMGTGKTLCALALLELWQARRVLILCPKSVAEVWRGEFAKHTRGWTCAAYSDGPITKRAAAMTALLATNLPAVACVVNYDATWQGAMPAALKRPWDVVIFDECHRLKSAAGQQSRLASQLMHRATRRLGLTGTPMPHSPLDVYAQLRAIDKRVYGTSNAVFKSRYAVKGGFEGKAIVGYQNLPELEAKLAAVTFRCRAQDVLTLPDAQDSTRYCELTPAEARAYKEMEREMTVLLEAGEVTAANALVKLLRLQQITSGYLPIETATVPLGDSKRKLLGEVLEDLSPLEYGAAREPVVVFCRYKHDLAAVTEVCTEQGLRCGELSGAANDLAEWQAGGLDVLAVQLQAGGLGVDMTRARYCVYYSNSYSLGDYLQTRARVHRPGQTRPVTYIHLLARGTVDEVVLRALEKRQDVVEAVLASLLRK